MSKKVSETNTAKCEALAKLDEIHSNEVNKEVGNIHLHYLVDEFYQIYALV